MQDINKVLKKHFGYDSFRPGQEDVIKSIISGNDTVAVFATGKGKSICFQIPSLILKGTMLVITPLKSLMKDQVRHAKSFGIRAERIDGDMSYEEQFRVYQELSSGKLNILYISPERFFVQKFTRTIQSIKISAIVWDEFHTSDEWKGFRSSLKRLPAQLSAININCPKVGFTATASEELIQNLVDSFQFKNPTIFKSSFDRPNLFYEVRNKQGDGMAQIIDFISAKPDDCGIVYRCTRNDVEKTCSSLNLAGIEASPYHAGMSPQQRSRAQDSFIRGHVKIIVATIAFGMGIDKPDVRWVIHNDIPSDMSGLSQQQGRAGRDGKRSHCLFLFNPNDAAIVWRTITGGNDANISSQQVAKLNEVIDYAKRHICRRKSVLAQFGEEYEGNCGMCDVCCGLTKASLGSNIKKKLFKDAK